MRHEGRTSAAYGAGALAACRWLGTRRRACSRWTTSRATSSIRCSGRDRPMTTFAGLAVALATPFDRRGEVDLPAFRRLVRPRRRPAASTRSSCSGPPARPRRSTSASATWSSRRASRRRAAGPSWSARGRTRPRRRCRYTRRARELGAAGRARRHARTTTSRWTPASSRTMRRSRRRRPASRSSPTTCPGRTAVHHLARRPSQRIWRDPRSRRAQGVDRQPAADRGDRAHAARREDAARRRRQRGARVDRGRRRRARLGDGERASARDEGARRGGPPRPTSPRPSGSTSACGR